MHAQLSVQHYSVTGGINPMCIYEGITLFGPEQSKVRTLERITWLGKFEFSLMVYFCFKMCNHTLMVSESKIPHGVGSSKHGPYQALKLYCRKHLNTTYSGPAGMHTHPKRATTSI